jgi:hypothetical protein
MLTTSFRFTRKFQPLPAFQMSNAPKPTKNGLVPFPVWSMKEPNWMLGVSKEVL